MDSIYYFGTTIWTMFVNVAFLIATLYLMRKGHAPRITQTIFAVISVLWTALIYYVIDHKIIVPMDISGLSFYVITLGSALVVLSILYFTTFRNIFENINQEDIQWVQGLRVFVASGFFMEGVLKVIPGWFSIMDGFLHVSSGFLALVAAIAILKNCNYKNTLLWLANIVGLADIVIIVSSINFVVWKDLGPFHNMQSVVFYTGVLLLWFHLMSIKKLINWK